MAAPFHSYGASEECFAAALDLSILSASRRQSLATASVLLYDRKNPYRRRKFPRREWRQADPEAERVVQRRIRVARVARLGHQVIPCQRLLVEEAQDGEVRAGERRRLVLGGGAHLLGAESGVFERL